MDFDFVEKFRELRREVGDDVEARIITRQVRAGLAVLKDLKPADAPIHDEWLDAMKNK